MRTSLDTNILSAVWSKEVVPATLWPSWVKQDKQGCSSLWRCLCGVIGLPERDRRFHQRLSWGNRDCAGSPIPGRCLVGGRATVRTVRRAAPSIRRFGPEASPGGFSRGSACVTPGGSASDARSRSLQESLPGIAALVIRRISVVSRVTPLSSSMGK